MVRFSKEFLGSLGLSQAELSRYSGVSTTTINKICTQNLGGKTLSEATKGKLVNGINKFLDKEKYKVNKIKFD